MSKFLPIWVVLACSMWFLFLSNQPETTITSADQELIADNSLEFTFTSDDVEATFECSLDQSVFETCSSPFSYQDLSDGAHTFKVRALNSSEVDQTPAEDYFIVDAQIETWISSRPHEFTIDKAPDFYFTSDARSQAYFECSLDQEEFTACSSPYLSPILKVGKHDFRVRAYDAVGREDPTPAEEDFEVTTNTFSFDFKKHPKKKTLSSKALFTYKSSIDALYQCKLDDQPFRDCDNETSFKHLKRGKHIFTVTAKDEFKNEKAISYTWQRVKKLVEKK